VRRLRCDWQILMPERHARAAPTPDRKRTLKSFGTAAAAPAVVHRNRRSGSGDPGDNDRRPFAASRPACRGHLPPRRCPHHRRMRSRGVAKKAHPCEAWASHDPRTCLGSITGANFRATRTVIERNGRSGEIRTPDPLLPKQVRYQAALRSARPFRVRATLGSRHDATGGPSPGRPRWSCIPPHPSTRKPFYWAQMRDLRLGFRARPRDLAVDPVPRYHAGALAHPCGCRSKVMGRSQVVRQRILIPSCGGSNPPAPASTTVAQVATARMRDGAQPKNLRQRHR
jgi:hypothetical protein